jgi:hypothetical protein
MAAIAMTAHRTCSPDGAERNPGCHRRIDIAPGFASLHPATAAGPIDIAQIGRTLLNEVQNSQGAAMETAEDIALIRRMAEERAVCRVLNVWAYSRDSGDWDSLRNCFHPDGTIIVSWFSGSAADFVERSKAITQARRPQERSKHLLGNMRADVNGSRAVLEADAAIMVREVIDEHLFDCVSHSRFFHLMEKRNGEWRILRANCIYEKDRMDPVIPGSVPPSFYDQIDLSGPDNGFAFMRFRQTKKGRTIPPVPMAGSVEEAKLRADARTWLAGKST